MLATPSAALGGAGQPTPRRTELLADWIELSAFAEEEEVYRPVVEGRIRDAYFVKDDEDAARAVGDAWRVLRRRNRFIGDPYPFEIGPTQVVLKNEPDYRYLFLLLLSSPEYFSGFSLTRGGGFRNLFELVTVDAVRDLLPSWDVFWVGATSKDMRSAGGVVSYIGSLLKTRILNRTHFQSAQDGGVDFLAVHYTEDHRPAGPAFWGQCATGLNWSDKLEEPSFKLWRNALSMRTDPVRAFAIPFCLDAQNWDLAAVGTAGWVLDRERLARTFRRPIDAKLSGVIKKWLDGEKKRLPAAA